MIRSVQCNSCVYSLALIYQEMLFLHVLYVITIQCLMLYLQLCRNHNEFSQPLSALLTTRALSDSTSLPWALFPLIPPFCLILYLDISFHASFPLLRAASCAPQWRPITLRSVLHFPSLLCAHCVSMHLQSIVGVLTFSCGPTWVTNLYVLSEFYTHVICFVLFWPHINLRHP